jgi:hypothetical protein
MHRRLVSFLLVGVVCLSFAACKKDSDVNSTMADIHAVTDEVVKRVNASPTVAGVDDAQKYWDSKKADLKSKWEDVKKVRDAQVSEDTKKKMAESYLKDSMAIKTLTIKHMGVSIRDTAFKSKLDSLVKEWEVTFPLK